MTEPKQQQASEMVERVAKALWDMENPRDPWDGSPDKWKHGARDLARAAIAAMREPTEAMLDAPEMRSWAWRTDEPVEPEEVADAWRAMIDAALSGSSVGHQIQPVAPVLDPAGVSDAANKERLPATFQERNR